jgi:hypothetical protein
MNADGTSETIGEAINSLTTTALGRIDGLTKQRDDLVLCLEEVLDGFTSGKFTHTRFNDAGSVRDFAVLINRSRAAIERRP